MTDPILFSRPMLKARHIQDRPDHPQWRSIVAPFGIAEVWDSGRWEFSDPSGNRIVSSFELMKAPMGGAELAARECEAWLLGQFERLIKLESSALMGKPYVNPMPPPVKHGFIARPRRER